MTVTLLSPSFLMSCGAPALVTAAAVVVVWVFGKWTVSFFCLLLSAVVCFVVLSESPAGVLLLLAAGLACVGAVFVD